jgi:hypothetical protein
VPGRPAFPAAQGVVTFIQSHPVQPADDVNFILLPPNLFRTVVQLQKGLLGNIFRLRSISEQAKEDPTDPVVMA